ncbi:BMP family ABC transporter substrate-binding protein [Oceanirhabdus sp. W0125-5]|uniref:BMP family ABC transporter substrate-binding protein n=1 Tax=Oceanirhabdus sp. W0125-5 TaxID=2999116 RepID=UPI0022F3059D|nr:BMP family ABC transporter substrate-binding protein [Oceanirhabdus sp. W0125-5]WBW94745.1 BMP family ABC transporter substrate-binding protein [Oceanirhabdus sp. W0125-5]
MAKQFMDINTNIYNEYESAKKKARNEQLRRRSEGEDGFLLSLDRIIKDKDIVAEVPLGIKSIPIKKIVGTYYYTRSRDFSSGFLPLKEQNTEFAEKWKSLCKSHLEEGIRDPIRVYEFMNKYYVMEGNKRVSVLKYFDGHSIEGDVTRLIPKKDETDKENKLYYEFLDFSNKTGIYDIWFKKRIFFRELLNYLEEYKPDPIQGRDKYEHFYKKFYIPFRVTYKEIGGDKLKITTGDAILEYIRIYGLSNEFKFKRKGRVEKLFEELLLAQDVSKVEIQTEPFEVFKGNMITSITNLVTSTKKINVAFLYEKNIDSSAWAYTHEKGRRFAQNILSDKINTCYFDNIPIDDNEAYEKIKEIAEKGFDIIFTTSQKNLRATLRAALKYEHIKFFCCSPVQAFRNMSTYFGRSHETMFLLGMIAGAMTRTNVIGCIEQYNRTATITGINAFALGVKSVNDSAKVNVIWTDDYENIDKKMKDIKQLGDIGADLVLKRGVTEGGMSGRNIALYPIECDEKSEYTYGEYLCTIKWDWGKFYEKVLRNITNGSWKGIFSTESKRVSFMWGIDSGIIDIKYHKSRINFHVGRTIKLVRQGMIDNQIHTFEGPIYDNKKVLRIGEKDYASYNKMLYMDWFVENVTGDIPKKY